MLSRTPVQAHRCELTGAPKYTLSVDAGLGDFTLLSFRRASQVPDTIVASVPDIVSEDASFSLVHLERYVRIDALPVRLRSIVRAVLQARLTVEEADTLLAPIDTEVRLLRDLP